MGGRKDEICATTGHQIPFIQLRDSSENPESKKNSFVFLCAIVASMSSLLAGYDIGVMSGAAIYIQQDFNISDLQLEVLVGIVNLYAVIGIAASGATSDLIGRRKTLLLSAAFFFLGALLMGFSPNYAVLMSGRFFAGVGAGFAPLTTSVYIAEVSPSSSRGCLSTFTEVLINVGILLGYISNFAFSNLPTHLGWRFMLGIGFLPSVLLATVVILVMPESPRWLVMHGRIREAKQVLIRTSDSIEDSLQRLADIKNAVGIPASCEEEVVLVPKQSTHGSVWKELFLRPTPAVRHILITAVGINFVAEATGMDAVVLYSPRIFEKAGISSSDQKLLATVAVGITKTAFVSVAAGSFDRIGRRPLILTSVAGKIISLIGLGTGLMITENSHERVTWGVGLCIAMVLSDVAFYSMGMGPMCFVSSEFFPLKLRAKGVSVGLITNRIIGAVVTMTFLSLYRAISIGGAFFLYAAIATAGWLFLYMAVPETRGVNLENVEGLFGNFGWKLFPFSQSHT